MKCQLTKDKFLNGVYYKASDQFPVVVELPDTTKLDPEDKFMVKLDPKVAIGGPSMVVEQILPDSPPSKRA